MSGNEHANIKGAEAAAIFRTAKARLGARFWQDVDGAARAATFELRDDGGVFMSIGPHLFFLDGDDLIVVFPRRHEVVFTVIHPDRSASMASIPVVDPSLN